MMMMLGPKKKKMVSTIVAQIVRQPIPKKMDEEGKEYDEMEMGLESAASEIIKALEAKDSKALMTALKDFIYLCQEDDQGEMKE
jgi:ABC-type Zn uptake system ZnuABC Zn-binding protein ZnuA